VALLAQEEYEHYLNNCGYPDYGARECAWKVFPPPEPQEEDDLERELAEMEAEYQAMMRPFVADDPDYDEEIKNVPYLS
jgi:hypothetical protein